MKKLNQTKSTVKPIDRTRLPRATHASSVRFGDLEADGYVLQEGEGDAVIG